VSKTSVDFQEFTLLSFRWFRVIGVGYLFDLII